MYAASIPPGLEGVPSTLAIATRALLAALGDATGLRLLDLGCGEGHVARRVQATAGGAVVGVDICGELLRLARERSPGIALVQDDAQALGAFAPDSFDLVYSNLALMDMPDLPAVYRAVHRVLVPGGRFVFTLVHPCFAPPGGYALEDDQGRFAAYAIRRYTEEGFWRSEGRGTIRSLVGAHHRTLSTYVNGLIAAGFTLRALDEPTFPARPGLSLYQEGSVHLPPVLLISSTSTA